MVYLKAGTKLVRYITAKNIHSKYHMYYPYESDEKHKCIEKFTEIRSMDICKLKQSITITSNYTTNSMDDIESITYITNVSLCIDGDILNTYVLPHYLIERTYTTPIILHNGETLEQYKRWYKTVPDDMPILDKLMYALIICIMVKILYDIYDYS